MCPGQMRVVQPGAAIEIRPAIIALGRYRHTSEDLLVELGQPAPVVGDDVDVADTVAWNGSLGYRVSDPVIAGV